MRIGICTLLLTAAAYPVLAQPAIPGTPVEQAVMRYIDIQPGTGAAATPGRQYTVHYTGWLRDGTQFDSSAGKDPLKFVQGRREVIPGFDTGFEGMRAGAKRRLFIPYQFAYGETGRGSIPPKAELIFDIELLDVKEAPAPTASAELLAPLNAMADKVLALARAVPAEKYSWRPGEGLRSFQQVFQHIAYGNQLLLSGANGASADALRKQVSESVKNEARAMTKDEVLAILNESFAAVRKALEAERTAGLNRNIEFFGAPATRRGVFTNLDLHIAEHLGQAIAYARANGIVPPWSR